ncbi:EID1-like F-box protein 2 [Acorus calamus]|uniref:EID1-like F-box protein 2 n=1 Tax=Acorus calamus TaxID=4465 RepID=A0AAV9D5Y3_ACOCL|nr:EID1-like F-box protein 2 [Acorus calamus]
MLVTKQFRCIHSSTCVCTKGHLSEDAIYLVFQHENWNPTFIAKLSCVCKWFDDIAKRVLWKEFCRTRAPKMMLDLQSNGSHNVDGNWKALGKLLIYCSGSRKGGLFNGIHILVILLTGHAFRGHQGKAFFCLGVGQTCCMSRTLVSISIKEMKVMWGSFGVFSSHFRFPESGRCLFIGKPNSTLQRSVRIARQNCGICYKLRWCQGVPQTGWGPMMTASSIMCV